MRAKEDILPECPVATTVSLIGRLSFFRSERIVPLTPHEQNEASDHF